MITDRNVYEISPGSQSGNYGPGVAIMPDQAIAEDAKTPDWYLQNARYISNQYNPVLFNFQSISGLQDMDQQQRWASRSLLWYSYYFGNQQVAEYNSVVRDEQNQPLPIKMFKDQSIPMLINHMIGNVKDVINVLPEIIDAVGLSEDIISVKEMKRDIAKFALDYPEIMQKMQMYGAQIVETLQFDQEQELTEHFEQNSKEMAEEIFENFAIDALYRNRWREVFTTAARDALVVGFGCIRTYAQNGRPVYKRVAPHNAIWDSSVSSPQNRGGRYAGEIYQMTVPEIAARWGDQLGLTAMKTLEVIAKNQKYQQPFNIMLPNTNLIFWAQGAAGVSLATIVDTEWVGMKQLSPGKFTATRYQATLIANKFVVDFRECDNIIEDEFDPSDTMLSYRIVTPVIEYGYAQGVTEKLYRMSDLLSMYRTKMIQLIARSKGKNYIIRSWKLPEAVRTPELMADFSRMGLTVINDASEEDDPNTRLVEPIDMTMDPTVVSLINVLAEMKSTMEDVISLPAAVRGSVNGYQSVKSLQQNKAQSNKGIQIYYDALFEFFENVISYSAEMYKKMACSDELYESALIVGDKQVKWLKLETSDIRFSKLRIYLKFDDASTDQQRAEIIADLQQAVNRGELDAMDIVRVRMLKSVRKIYNYLKARYATKKREQIAQQQQEAAAAQAMNERNAQAQENSAAIAGEAGLQKQQMMNDAKASSDFINMANNQQNSDPLGIRK